MNKNENNIVLIGFMGTGKTTVGMLLSERLNFQFIDTDKLIEDETKKTINQIFKEDGEEAFRTLEKDIIKRVCLMKNTVISTGGGIVLHTENLKKLSESGMVVCLKSNAKTILERTSADSSRPLLVGDNPLTLITERLNSRKALYMGELNLDTSNLSPEEATDRILAYRKANAPAEAIRLNAPSGSYDILVGGNIFHTLSDVIKPITGKGSFLLVTSDYVATLWGEKALQLLNEKGMNGTLVTIPDGEIYKSYESAMKIYTAALENKLDRASTIIAVGGGVIGDLAGFVASTYMRGIKVIQIPTTLLAQVDSSIGGKTAINHPNGKNMIGTFHQPSLVFSDTSVLTTLSKEEFINGLAEVIKYGVILDKELFEFLEQNVEKLLDFDQNTLNYVVKKCSFLKKTIVEKDEKESGIRALLNYGHTIGHGIEAAGNYTAYRHGEAVAIGMELAGALALSKGLFSKEAYIRQNSLLKAYGLPTEFANIDKEMVFQALITDKKNENGKLRMILPYEIGSARLNDSVTFGDIRMLLKLS